VHKMPSASDVGAAAATSFIAGAGALTGPASPLTIGTAAGAATGDFAAAAHAHEGTTILSTGEAGGTKFLREDGDGTCSWQTPAGGGEAWDGDIADINLDGGTDIGAALVDDDLILVDDGGAGTNRKSALSRVWTYLSGKITAGIAPYLTGYTQQGMATAAVASAYYSGSTLTIPLDGRVYSYTLSAATTIAFSGAPTAPVCADTVLILKQAADTAAFGITAWPSGIKWPGGVPQTMPQTYSSRMRVVVSTDPAGVIDVSATWMGV